MSKKNDGIRMIWFPLASSFHHSKNGAQGLSVALAALLLTSPWASAQTGDAASAPEAAASATSAAPAPPLVALPPAGLQMAAPSTLLPPPTWAALSRSQQLALSPLERDWDKLDPARKSKWLEVAARFLALPSEEQARMHERMRAWARLSPAERQQARIGYQVAQQVKADERQAKWEAYQALSPERRQELAEKAAQKQQKPGGKQADARLGTQTKSNLVPAAPKNQLVKPVAPSVVQAKPGVSTVLITQAKQLPSHQQAGQTKIFADPTLVDSKTLLPKRTQASSSQ